MHGHKESYEDLNLKNFDLRVGLETHDLMNTSLMLYQLSYQGSDESSLGFFKVYKFLIKFNHLYLGTGCVCFFGGKGRGGGGHPICTDTRRVMKI